MGYNLYITRKDWWADPEGPSISIHEWVAFASNCPDLILDPGKPATHENWIMVGHPEKWPLWWFNGVIETKNPDSEAIATMVRIAQALNARVLGENDEVYGTDPGKPSSSVNQ